MSESKKRSLVKTITWRLSGSTATFLISYAISNNLSVAGSIAIIQMVANTLLYFIHERLWNSLDWGRE